MSSLKHTRAMPAVGRLLTGLVLLEAFGAAPLRAGNLHAVWQDAGSSAIVDQMLLSLAEDPRSNRLLLNTSMEHLRSFLLQRLCPESVAGCADSAGVPRTHGLELAPVEIDLLLQHLNSALQLQQLPQPQQRRLLEQFSLQGSPGSAARPLASL